MRAVFIRSCPRRYLATVHPLPSSCTRLSTGTSTSSKNTSLTSWPPSIRISGRTVMPRRFMSTRRNEMPSWRRSESAPVRTRQKIQSAMCAERGPDLLAVHDIAIAMADRRHPKRREVGPGAGLGIALAPEVVPAIDSRQEMLLLRFGAELDQHGAAHQKAEGDDRRRRPRSRIPPRTHSAARCSTRSRPTPWARPAQPSLSRLEFGANQEGRRGTASDSAPPCPAGRRADWL